MARERACPAERERECPAELYRRKGKAIRRQVVWADEVGKALVKVGECIEDKFGVKGDGVLDEQELISGKGDVRARLRDCSKCHLLDGSSERQLQTVEVCRVPGRSRRCSVGEEVNFHSFGKGSAQLQVKGVNVAQRVGTSEASYSSAEGGGKGYDGCCGATEKRRRQPGGERRPYLSAEREQLWSRGATLMLDTGRERLWRSAAQRGVGGGATDTVGAVTPLPGGVHIRRSWRGGRC